MYDLKIVYNLAQTNGGDGRSKRSKAILSIGTKWEESGLSRKGDALHLIVSTVKDVLKHKINLYYNYVNGNITIDRNHYNFCLNTLLYLVHYCKIIVIGQRDYC